MEGGEDMSNMRLRNGPLEKASGGTSYAGDRDEVEERMRRRVRRVCLRVFVRENGLIIWRCFGAHHVGGSTGQVLTRFRGITFSSGSSHRTRLTLGCPSPYH